MNPATPQKRNGSYDWSRWFGVVWPVLMVVGTIMFTAGGRLSSPQERRIEIKESLAPYAEDIHDLRSDFQLLRATIRQHEQRDGHATITERVNSLDARLSRLESMAHPADN
jgi:hypothetical protein